MRDRIALVTGAAGGIGAAVTRLLAASGTTVAAVDRDTGRLTAAVAALAADGLPVTRTRPTSPRPRRPSTWWPPSSARGGPSSSW
ncbi:hypothetical protein SUDANB19_06407 [Streptomyces sp. enrichment culture]